MADTTTLDGALVEQVVSIMAMELDVDESVLTQAATPDEILSWDSLKLLNIVVSLEQEFGIEIDPPDVERMVSVGDILNLVAEKKA